MTSSKGSILTSSKGSRFLLFILPHDNLLLDSAPNIGPLVSLGNLTNSKSAQTKALDPLKS